MSGRREEVARALAGAFLEGVWTERAMVDRAAGVLASRPRWLRRVVRSVRTRYPRPPHARSRQLVRVIVLALPDGPLPRVARMPVTEPRMGRRRWPVAELDGVSDLADVLELDHGQLAWLADVRGLERKVESARLRNYNYDLLRRASGLPRVIERPKRRLAEVQRWVLREILDHVPPHPAAHGFRRGRSVLTNAAAHTGAEVVVRFDLEDFFASVEAGRVFGIFLGAGYAEGVAHALTGLCTNVVPRGVLGSPVSAALVHPHERLRRRLATPHLPQGAPTSPALANLAAFALDRRLDGLARSLDATYTRYADDLAFSGGGRLHAAAGVLRRAVAEIVREEGFVLRRDKTLLVTRAGRQRVCGIVVNEHPNVPRAEYDRLKAVLHDAARNGPDAANRQGHPEFRAHLLGRIAWVAAVNPARGEKLRERFDAIAW